ncbi:hypothetical protein AMTRI_Chr01g110110 [Amborella trichopoda]
MAKGFRVVLIGFLVAGVADLMLISINVHESTGHLLSCNLRFLVRVDDTVIQTALRSHDHHGRLPSLRPVVPISRTRGKNFLLYKKKQEEYYFGEQYKQQGRRGGKQWINKSLSFNLLSH